MPNLGHAHQRINRAKYNATHLQFIMTFPGFFCLLSQRTKYTHKHKQQTELRFIFLLHIVIIFARFSFSSLLCSLFLSCIFTEFLHSTFFHCENPNKWTRETLSVSCNEKQMHTYSENNTEKKDTKQNEPEKWNHLS